MEGNKFLYGDLSEKIISLAYKIYHELGYGHPEKVYQKSLAIELKNAKIDFRRECYAKILYDGEIVGKYFLASDIIKNTFDSSNVVPKYFDIV